MFLIILIEHHRVATAQNRAKSAPIDSNSYLEKMINTTPKQVGRAPLNNSTMTPNNPQNHEKQHQSKT